jgi:hypothetical protein
MEFGAHVGLWSLVDQDGLVGGRFGKRVTEWLVAEGMFDKSTNSNAHREHRLVLANVRLQPPNVPDERRLFITVGLAAATGLSYSWSPMIGVGGQLEHDRGAVAMRMEIQIFPRGQREWVYDRARLLVGFSVGLP